MKKYFGSIVEEEWKIPKYLFLLSILKVFIKHPIETLFYKLIINNFSYSGKNYEFSRWHLAQSTKDI
jgi:hypothetical protein